MNLSVRFILAFIIFMITGILALSPHVLISQLFTPPEYQISHDLNQILGFIIRILTIIGAALIYYLSKAFWQKLKFPYRQVLFSLLIMGLTEQLLRPPIMSILVGVSWLHQILLT